jgi:ADP-ribose pyrophosphatase
MIETTRIPFRISSPEVLYQDRVRHIYRVFAEFDGFTKEYYVSDCGQRAAVLVVRQDQVLLTRRYRLLVNELTLEVPGGRVNSGETPEAAGVRECQEETGVKCFDLKHLIGYEPGLDVTQNHTEIFYTHEFVDLEPVNSERRMWLPLKQCLAMVFAGEIVDGLSMMALLAFGQLRSAG